MAKPWSHWRCGISDMSAPDQPYVRDVPRLRPSALSTQQSAMRPGRPGSSFALESPFYTTGELEDGTALVACKAHALYQDAVKRVSPLRERRSDVVRKMWWLVRTQLNFAVARPTWQSNAIFSTKSNFTFLKSDRHNDHEIGANRVPIPRSSAPGCPPPATSRRPARRRSA